MPPPSCILCYDNHLPDLPTDQSSPDNNARKDLPDIHKGFGLLWGEDACTEQHLQYVRATSLPVEGVLLSLHIEHFQKIK